MNGLEFEQMGQDVVDAVVGGRMDEVLRRLQMFMALEPCELDFHKIAGALVRAACQQDGDVLRTYLLEHLPRDWWVVCYFADELHGRRIPAAGGFYERALERWPNQASLLGDYAQFLQGVRGETDLSEAFFRRALEREPENVHNLRRYAYFLRQFRGSSEEAKVFDERANALAAHGDVGLEWLGASKEK